MVSPILRYFLAPRGALLIRTESIDAAWASISSAMNNSSQFYDQAGDSALSLEPMWTPSDDAIRHTNIHAALRELSLDSYDCLYRWSVAQPEKFWDFVIKRLNTHFERQPQRTLDLGGGPAHAVWAPGARLNIAESCFQAAPDAPAILHRSEGGDLSAVSYRELRCLANQVASGLRRLDLAPGDAVALFMPMTARAVAIYLGTILAGCVVVSIADSFSAEQVALRLRIGQTKAIFTVASMQRGGKRFSLFDRIRAVGGLRAILADEQPSPDVALRAGDLFWENFVGDSAFDDVAYLDPQAPTNVLFSSGTTGDPKAISWDHITPVKAASDGHFHQDIHPGDVVGWPTSFGWMMGPWLTYATLINRGTMAVFDGSPLDRPFGRFVEDARINILGVVPSMVSRWRQSGCMEGLDWSAIRAFSSTGECSNPDDMRYLSRLAGGKPVIDYCGGTELGGGYIGCTMVQPNIPAAFSTPTLGTALIILDESGQRSDVGELYLIPPAIGMSHHILNGDHAAVYFDGAPSGPQGELLRRHGDLMQALPGGYFRALGRADDTLNVGGMKVGAAELERVIASVERILEAAVIGAPTPGGGPTRLIACVGVGPPPYPETEELRAEMQSALNSQFSPLFKLHDVFVLDHLPRTASNKILRRELRTLYEAERSQGAAS